MTATQYHDSTVLYSHTCDDLDSLGDVVLQVPWGLLLTNRV